MRIRHLTVTNLKSFGDTRRIDFNTGFNILIGPNGSGKSNLLDITNMILRNHFLLRAVISAQHMNRNQKHFHRNPSFGEDMFEKYVGKETDPTVIEIGFEIEQIDIDNMVHIKQSKDKYISTGILYTEGNQQSDTHYAQIIDSLNTAIVNAGEIVFFKIENNSIQTMQAKELVVHAYLTHYEMFYMLEYTLNRHFLKPLSIFFSPYRTFAKENLSATLANQNFHGIAQKSAAFTSRSSDTFTDIAAHYFAEKHLLYEKNARDKGFGEMWDNDPEVQRISYYLNILGYGWEIKAVNPNANQYEIFLTKNGLEFRVGQASSGEREIINFILGIFALNVKNGIIFIEEPELHLHPKWQKILIDVLIKIVEETNNQFFITTHSPSFITAQSLPSLIRVYKNNEMSQVSTLNESADLRIKDMLHMINSTNNEKIFFCDVVIFVEGITDVMVFSKILSLALADNKQKVIEIVDIGGKNNFPKYKQFANSLNIPAFFIADFDYYKQTANSDVKKLMIPDNAKIETEIKKQGSKDGQAIVDAMEEAIAENSFEKLKGVLGHVRSKRLKLQPSLSEDNQKTIEGFVKELARIDSIYLLRRGEIEDYMPIGYKEKDLDKVIKLLGEEEFIKWQADDSFKELAGIVQHILKRIFTS